LNDLYDSLGIEAPDVVLTDSKIGLVSALRSSLYISSHHSIYYAFGTLIRAFGPICRPEFESIDDWDVFSLPGMTVMYAQQKVEYQDQ